MCWHAANREREERGWDSSEAREGGREARPWTEETKLEGCQGPGGNAWCPWGVVRLKREPAVPWSRYSHHDSNRHSCALSTGPGRGKGDYESVCQCVLTRGERAFTRAAAGQDGPGWRQGS
eukprot:584781-Rhodomonas_salina.1